MKSTVLWGGLLALGVAGVAFLMMFGSVRYGQVRLTVTVSGRVVDECGRGIWQVEVLVVPVPHESMNLQFMERELRAAMMPGPDASLKMTDSEWGRTRRDGTFDVVVHTSFGDREYPLDRWLPAVDPKPPPYRGFAAAFLHKRGFANLLIGREKTTWDYLGEQGGQRRASVALGTIVLKAQDGARADR